MKNLITDGMNIVFYLKRMFLGTVLHLGNVYFHRKQLKHGQEGVEIGSDAEIRWTGHLLRLDVDGIKEALTTKTTVRVRFLIASQRQFYSLVLRRVRFFFDFFIYFCFARRRRVTNAF